jgi:hypothetical protein
MIIMFVIKKVFKKNPNNKEIVLIKTNVYVILDTLEKIVNTLYVAKFHKTTPKVLIY